jgi:hypothetical protein
MRLFAKVLRKFADPEGGPVRQRFGIGRKYDLFVSVKRPSFPSGALITVCTKKKIAGIGRSGARAGNEKMDRARLLIEKAPRPEIREGTLFR